jgi:hypothetical protein
MEIIRISSFVMLRRALLIIFALILALGGVRLHAQGLNSQEAAIAYDMATNSQQGRPTMIFDPVIQAVAMARAKDMAARNYFSHVNPDGVAANYLLAQAGYELPAWWGTDKSANYVESIAAGYSDPGDTWTAWMNSPPHKEHLLGLNSFFATETHYGIGYYYDANSTYKYYWVVITAPPQPVAITSPARGSVVRSGTLPVDATLPVAGTTDPAAGAAAVQFRIENTSGTSDWVMASGSTAWSGTLSGLTPGVNVLRAQSLDGSGNVLAENAEGFTYLEQADLSVAVSGSGNVFLGTASIVGTSSQNIGATVALRAAPAPGSIFVGWTGSVVSGGAVLRFPMAEGESLTANFEPNPFPVVSGAYYGVVTDASQTEVGMVTIDLTKSGAFTGRVIIFGSTFGFAGALNASGVATVTIPLAGGPVTIALQADLTGGSGQITGTVTDGDSSYSFTGDESSYAGTTANSAPETGRYTMVLSPDSSVSGTYAPAGNGFAVIMVNARGGAVMTGRLADGTPFSASGHVGNDGALAIYARPLGSPAGSSVVGQLTFQSTSVSDVAGYLQWTKGASTAAAYYPSGFSIQSPAVGSRFVPAATAAKALAISSGTATAGLGGGNLTAALEVPMTINAQNQATMTTSGEPGLALTINPLNGAVMGHFTMPNANGARAVGGVILQKQNSAYGFFRGLNEDGIFSLTE